MQKNRLENDKVGSLVDEAIPFLRNFGHVVRLCALHTYYSALPLTPKRTRLFEYFAHGNLQVPEVTSSHPTWPTICVRVIEGHTDSVSHVVFSPDGMKLASGSYDNTVRLWDVETGQPIGSALEGHANRVNHVVFSPDGKKLASGSYDSTVRLWDVETGQPIGPALETHKNNAERVIPSDIKGYCIHMAGSYGVNQPLYLLLCKRKTQQLNSNPNPKMGVKSFLNPFRALHRDTQCSNCGVEIQSTSHTEGFRRQLKKLLLVYATGQVLR